MDTNEVADAIGTTPRKLRQFLRSPYSTFVAVGSGARYDFTTADVETIQKRFNEWDKSGEKRNTAQKRKKVAQRRSAAEVQRERDAEVWMEEGPVVLEDIRDPEVRAYVRAVAREQEDRLMLRLMAKGMHVAQQGDSWRSA